MFSKKSKSVFADCVCRYNCVLNITL